MKPAYQGLNNLSGNILEIFIIYSEIIDKKKEMD